ncbi:MAG TPA: HIT family protein [Vicinamibacteria bacterium]|nr:HIT family protein [Vicinamibacteria bacterium]
MAASCVFCGIVREPERAEQVFADESTIAFLDHRPLFPGHVLVVPRAHHETLADLPPPLIAPLFGAARLLTRAVEAALGAEGTFVALNNKVSQSVPHLHVHVIPRRKGDGLRGFFWPRVGYLSPEHMRETGDRIRTEASRLGPAR